MVRSNIRRKDKACLLKRTGFVVFITFLLLTLSCDTVNQQGGVAGRIMPNITGGTGEVLVVMDQLNWTNSAGELLQDILKEEYPGLPQSEPIFDVIQVTASSFDGVYRFHRSIVLTTVTSGLEPRIRFKENIWAKPQIMVQIEAPTAVALRELISENESQIRGFLIQYDRNRLMNVYKESKDPAIQKDIATHHQVRLAIPRGYNMDFSTEEYTSVSIESPDLSQVIQVYDYPAEGPEDLNIDNIIEKRNSFTKKFVEGPSEDSYMTISSMYKPIAYDLRNNNRDVVEMRGLWDLENGFMGGPFVSHSVYDAKRGRIVTVEGYVYYPNQKKRVKIRQLEEIIYSMDII
ncbi:MAG: DUF4837 family protein [Bacteroidales bacterium]|nr:DUF4837 family protein [Bacteroidales bacterium]